MGGGAGPTSMRSTASPAHRPGGSTCGTARPMQHSADRPIRRVTPFRTMAPVPAALRALFDEPAVADAPRRVRRDWALVGLLMPVAVLEAVLRHDVPWRWLTLGLTLVLLPTLLWRRTHPLACVGAGFGAMLLLGVVDLLTDPPQAPGLYTMAALLLTLYALVRWGSGRDVVVGSVVVLVTGLVCVAADWTGIVEALGGLAVLVITALAGATVRLRSTARHRELEQVRAAEREHLARDLHDTVAHHVSAIAIRAQAGLAVAPTRPDAAVDALRVIEAEASRTLGAMRAMVGVLRRDDPVQLAPTPTLDDLRRLAATTGDGPRVEVRVAEGVGDVGPTTATALYRIAQESLTNARRHGRHVTLVTITVQRDGDAVHLRVADDGEPAGPSAGSGYGIIGMTERAELLGGACTAGPAPRGWLVTAALPVAAGAR